MHEVVVTGWGIVAPLGTRVAAFAERMFAGRSGIVDIRGRRVAHNFPIPCAGLVPEDELGQPELLAHLDPADTPRSWRFAGLATEEAVAGLPLATPVDAVVYATADGTSFDLIRDSFRGALRAGFEWRRTCSEAPAEVVAGVLERRGSAPPARNIVAVNNACVSANQALGMALQRIRRGIWERAVVGGVDARCDDNNFMNFHLLGALTTAEGLAPHAASRPFSRDRTGFVRGEGAGTLLLESRAAAEARGARVLGEVAGYAASSDAYRLTDGRPDGLAVVHAMRRAVEDAGLSTDDVDAISAHGTSTAMNDLLETRAIKALFGARAYRIPVTSLKSQVGHATVAAGAFEAVASLLMLQQQRLAPTINYGEPDPECDLDYVPNVSRPAELRAVLSNNFGFGGQNACVVFRRAS